MPLPSIRPQSYGHIRTTTDRRAWLVWSAALAVYVVAVLQRTSLSVAGIAAAHRFDASASSLAALAALQLFVYAGLQVPAGMAVDRFGPRRLVIGGAALMAAAQVLLAVSFDLRLAVLARALVGAGDAMTFVSVLRLVNAWFPARRVPLVTQLTGMVGQAGQLLSSVPLAVLLHDDGWTATFCSAAALGVLSAVLGVIVLRDSPDGQRPEPVGGRAMCRALRAAWRQPGTRLGLWTHFTCQFSGTVFTLLWGFPFLVVGEGVSSATAARMMTLFFVGFVVAGPLIGRYVAFHPDRRPHVVLGIVGMTVALWTTVLVWPGRAPLGLLVALVFVLAVGVPGSMVGFDFARSANPASRLGAATGIVNIGGFVAALLTLAAFGVAVRLSQGDSAGYSPASLKIGWCVQYAVWTIGVVGIVRARRKVAREGAGTSEQFG